MAASHSLCQGSGPRRCRLATRTIKSKNYDQRNGVLWSFWRQQSCGAHVSCGMWVIRVDRAEPAQNPLTGVIGPVIVRSHFSEGPRRDGEEQDADRAIAR